MRTRKQELVSDDLKPFVCNIMKEYREKYNYSLEDLARALNYKRIDRLYISMKQVLLIFLMRYFLILLVFLILILMYLMRFL